MTISDLDEVVSAINSLARSICPDGPSAPCPTGEGYVGSLTEAVMGVAAGLTLVARAIDGVAEAMENRR